MIQLKSVRTKIRSLHNKTGIVGVILYEYQSYHYAFATTKEPLAVDANHLINTTATIFAKIDKNVPKLQNLEP